MAIDFPNSPLVNDTFTVGVRTWKWDGTSWNLLAYGNQGFQGNQGTQGFQGTQGNQGAQGTQGNQGNQGNQGVQARLTTSDTAPSSPSVGDMWFNSATGSTFVWYDSYWVAWGQGSQGVGVPSGGTTGQVLAKNSATNYDAVWSSVGSAARPLLTGGAYLSGSGLVMTGLASNYASAPDSAALSITGDIDIAVKASMASWTPSAAQVLIAKYGSLTTRSYYLAVQTDGTLRVITSPDGSAIVDCLSTSPVGATANATKWVRVTLQVNNGAGSRVYKFYTSDNGTTWTQLGNTVTIAGTTSIYDGTQPLEIGSIFLGSTPFTGTIYRTIIRNGYDGAGSTVFDANFETATADALAFTESSTNAATVTINTTRYSYGVPGVAFNSVGTYIVAANFDYYMPLWINRATSVDMFGLEVTTGPASTSTIYYAIYSADDNLQPTGNPIIADSQSVSTNSTGVFRKLTTPTTLQPGAYVLTMNASVAMTVRRLVGAFPSATTATAVGANPFDVRYTASRTAAAYSGSLAAWNARGVGNFAFEYHMHLRYKAA